MATINRCARCHRRLRGGTGWNVETKAGVVVAFLCPTCQTPEENVEAEINEATVDYSTDAFGRIYETPKVVS